MDCPVCAVDDPIPGPEESRPEGWAHFPSVRDRHVAGLAEILGRKFIPPNNLAGDGVILCGEDRYWPGIVIAVRLLRETGCRLPVQVWHNGQIGRELGSDPLAQTIDVRQFRKGHPARIFRGWEMKLYAILHSGFRRLAFVDADAYFVFDPALLFAALGTTPFAFWRDLEAAQRTLHWEWFGLRGDDIPPIQGGQVLIDVAAFWRELMVTHWLCQHSDYTFQHGLSDQDMYRVALAGTKGRYASLGDVQWDDPALVCRWGNRIAVVHRTQGKFFPGALPRCNRRLPMELKAFGIFAELNPQFRDIVASWSAAKPAPEEVLQLNLPYGCP